MTERQLFNNFSVETRKKYAAWIDKTHIDLSEVETISYMIYDDLTYQNAISDYFSITEHNPAQFSPRYQTYRVMREYLYPYDIITADGKITKRIARWFKDNIGIKLSSQLMGKIGGILKNQSKMNCIMDFTSKFNWKAGDFGDGGSCYWGCRENARHVLEENGALAIRFFDENDKGIGRAWMYRNIDQNHIVLFNAYGTIAQNAVSCNDLSAVIDALQCMLKNETGITYNRKEMRLTNNGCTDGLIWINNGSGIVLSPDNLDYMDGMREYDLDIECSDYQCCCCGDALSEDDLCTSNDGEIYCQDCYYERYTSCARCGDEIYIGNGADIEYNGNVYCCEHCANKENVYRCESCDEYHDMDDMIITEDDTAVCQHCLEHDCFYCDICGLWFYDESNHIDHPEDEEPLEKPALSTVDLRYQMYLFEQ